jgi:hypothetical protein
VRHANARSRTVGGTIRAVRLATLNGIEVEVGYETMPKPAYLELTIL